MTVVFALDDWDRKLIAAAKSEGDRMEAVRQVWGLRVGLAPESVPLGPIIRRLAEIVDGCNLASLTTLLEQAELFLLASDDWPVTGILDAVVKGDFDAAKSQARRTLERANLLPKAAGTPPASSFATTWFWVLLNTIQCAPRSKLAMPCTA